MVRRTSVSVDDAPHNKSCNPPECGCSPEIGRRDFLKLGGSAAALFMLPTSLTIGREARLVLEDKKLDPSWVKSLTQRGRRSTYKRPDLKYIGMPVGGICAGQVYLGGDGRLWLWDIFNQIKLGVVDKTIHYKGSDISAGGGANYVEPPEQVHPFDQGFSIRLQYGEIDRVVKFEHDGWSEISFTGEYPIGFVSYSDPTAPVKVDLEAFSPFIPLDEDDSGLPATVMQFTVKNVSKTPVTATLNGWLENAIGLHTVALDEALRKNVAHGDSLVECSLIEMPNDVGEKRPDVVFDDFERAGYLGWEVIGTAFGWGPIERSKIPAYQGDVGGGGKWVVNSHNTRNGEDVAAADAHTGRLISHEFVISRRYIEFFIGGGNHPGKTCLNLVVNGEVVRSETGANSNTMHLAHFSVAEFEGRPARIEIVDEETGAWGNIGIDRIMFRDQVTREPLSTRPDFGTMSIGLLGKSKSDRADAAPTSLLNKKAVSQVSRQITLAPGAAEQVKFVVSWHFPNLELPTIGKVGRRYVARFANSADVIAYVQREQSRLLGDTKKWHDTWYDSTLPYWFLDRVMGNTATLATGTSERFLNGRFYGWEGIGCCEGTCGHVWQYAQAVARLFPALERTVREQVDFGIAFHSDSGIIDFRGEYGNGYATDSQAGYVLRAYREHQMSASDSFLHRVYPKAKKALEYLITQDANGDGIIENRQHNTLDVDLYGASSWLSSLYIAALRAGEEMAKEMKDLAFATQCRTIFERGSKNIAEKLWNGGYFIHDLQPGHPESLRYGDGCEVDQVMGQWWAWQVGLGRILDEQKTKKALGAIYRYNFLTDVGPFREENKPGRWYATPGEGGLLMCTFPKGDRKQIIGDNPTWASMYFNECMSGFEYEAAGHMVSEGMVQEGMAVTRAIHDRYSATKRNPWNEVECSDHYARCMAVYGVFVAACGFEHHGPKAHIGFDPKITPSSFKAAFTSAEGWGTYGQKIIGFQMEASLRIKHGTLRLKTLSLGVPSWAKNASAKLNDADLDVEFALQDKKLILTLATQRLTENDLLEVRIEK